MKEGDSSKVLLRRQTNDFYHNLNAMRSSARSNYASSTMSKTHQKELVNRNKPEEDHESQESVSSRETPMSQRKPTIIYHEEVTDIKSSIIGILNKSKDVVKSRSG